MFTSHHMTQQQSSVDVYVAWSSEARSLYVICVMHNCPISNQCESQPQLASRWLYSISDGGYIHPHLTSLPCPLEVGSIKRIRNSVF